MKNMQFGTWFQKGGSKYNSSANEKLWTSSHGILDINYLVWVLNQLGHKFEQVPKYKDVAPISEFPAGWNEVTGSSPFVSDLLSLESFRSHDTILIESCTGSYGLDTESLLCPCSF